MVSIGNKNGIDWPAIKAEYIGGGISQRKLAEKHGVTYAALRNKAENEGWLELRKEAQRKSNAKITQKVALVVSDNAVVYERMKTKALLKLERELDAVMNQDGTENRHTETWFCEEGKRSISETTIRKLADILSMMEKLAGAGLGANEPQLRAIKEILDGVPSAID